MMSDLSLGIIFAILCTVSVILGMAICQVCFLLSTTVFGLLAIYFVTKSIFKDIREMREKDD
jgi:hypothetical protein